MDYLPEDVETRFEVLIDAVSDTVENVADILAPGDSIGLVPVAAEIQSSPTSLAMVSKIRGAAEEKILEAGMPIVNVTLKSDESARTERIARLRESHEVVEDDSDLNDIYMYARSEIPLRRQDFMKDFPHAKALIITQEQLERIEALLDDGIYFSYITAQGTRQYVKAEDMNEPLVLFLEDLG